MAPPVLPVRLFTCQDVAAIVKLNPKVVARHFASREAVRLNHQTVRITDTQLAEYLAERSRRP